MLSRRLILLGVLGRGPRSGTSIARESLRFGVERRPSVYCADLRNMEKEGLVRELGSKVGPWGGRPAVTYELTDKGLKARNELAGTLARIMKGEEHGELSIGEPASVLCSPAQGEAGVCPASPEGEP